MPKNVVSETDAWSPTGGVVVGIGAVASGGNQTCEIQFFHAATINEWVFSGGCQVRIQISDMTGIVFERTEIFNAQSQV